MPRVTGSDVASGIVLPSSFGVLGDSKDHNGVAGLSLTSTAVSGHNDSDGAPAVRGDNNRAGGGVFGGSVDGRGVFGHSVNREGVYGYSTNSAGVIGEANRYGVFAISPEVGLLARNQVVPSNTALLGGTALAGDFWGPVRVLGWLTKPAGSFLIDHPLDPANQYLAHSFVESPEMKNIYDGIAVLDERGEATVELPVWFDALNRDLRYQLTAIGGHAPVFVAREMADNRFTIAGGKAGMKVSWQVTGNRKDAWATANPLVVEQPKPEQERGRFLYPEVLGEPPEKGIRQASPREPALQGASTPPAVP